MHEQLNHANKRLVNEIDQNLILEKQLEEKDAEIADLKRKKVEGKGWEG